jgi:amidase
MIAKAGDILKPVIKEANEIESLDRHPEYLARLKQQEMIRGALVALMDKYELAALVYPYKASPPAKIAPADTERSPAEAAAGSAGVCSRTGLPGLVAPMGLTSDGLPIGFQFLGRPFSEPTLIALGYAYEQTSPPRQAPSSTPALPVEAVRLAGTFSRP